MRKFSEEHLIALLKTNPDKGIQLIYDQYHEILTRKAFKLLKDEQEADDVVQEILISIWAKAAELSIDKALKAYLTKSVANRCYNVIRDKRNRNQILKGLDIPVGNHSSDQRVILTNLADRIQHLTKKLPARCQEIFFMSRWQHRTHQEIAAKLGISKKAVEKQITRAIRFLKQKLDDDTNMIFFFHLIEA